MNPRRLSLLAAVASNRVIGRNNAMPWHLPPDLQRFKALTMGHPIIMGRKTFESIGRPLPGRTSIVVSRQPDYRAEGALVVGSLATAIRTCYECADTDESFVIGGAEIFQQALTVGDRLYLTEIRREFQGDVLFPPFSRGEWREVSREAHRLEEEGGEGLEYHYVVLDRRWS
ncbi:dihydrofolate reductase [Nitrosovibrio sp. Nv17]|jgi:dihydrofolate reductase|uniref:dihydrofolate reductase n=1 Tax=Nitrosovibrio sp. Nv17 TaxID=1855339 RepID=UPI000908D1BD|nr:dihydrofolate reductase [Nitrosovibrio sp. Nv17]SFW16511.1 dihydrofolate reductase [Nitrosovibrio sp. Nv17]